MTKPSRWRDSCPEGHYRPEVSFHWVAQKDDSVHIVNVWASRKEFDEFAEKQAEIIREIGVDPASIKLTFFDVHNYLSGRR